ncbi:transcription initiation factor IIB family protein [Halorubrum halodurans]|uniref:Transcription factor TFIIB cyclin-like domain-containing protein n=1 Tax=Halorubrum halodurans TaxID=1383851 RepID=A0A256IIV9_9EURY|nr:hypothetical protein DJ70_08550 [Halorubrum halodurans]
MSQKVELGLDCPACESDEVETDVYGFKGFCQSCGFIIRDWTSPEVPDWKIESKREQESNKQDWLSFCRVRNSTEEQLALAFECIERLSSELAVSRSVREKAAKIYSEAFCYGTTNGRSTDCIVAACLSIASQNDYEPIPTSRLTDAASVTGRAFNSSQRALRDDLKIENRPSSSKEYLPFLSEALCISEHEYTSASDLVEKLSGSLELVGKSPIGIASAAIYLTSDCTQQQIADSAGISSETIRQRVGDIRELNVL